MHGTRVEYAARKWQEVSIIYRVQSFLNNLAARGARNYLTFTVFILFYTYFVAYECLRGGVKDCLEFNWLMDKESAFKSCFYNALQRHCASGGCIA